VLLLILTKSTVEIKQLSTPTTIKNGVKKPEKISHVPNNNIKSTTRFSTKRTLIKKLKLRVKHYARNKLPAKEKFIVVTDFE
jgi:hypothetical protein